MSIKLFNHSEVPHTFITTLHLPSGFNATHPVASITVPPRIERQVDYDIAVSSSANPGTYIITADVEWDQWKLSRWIEAIIEIE